MKLLTIVIPSYNTEAFINKNMKTFLDERLYDPVEILIINDGSKDRTAEFAKKYEEKYKGYIRLINKENGGHGSGINRGIIEAQGKYFKIVDADDWVNTENLVRLVSDLMRSDADVVINPYMTIDQRTKKKQLHAHEEIQTLPPESSFDLLIKKNIRLILHTVTYKTSILRENNITLTEKCFYEDWQYDLYPVPHLKTVTVLDYPVYWYLTGQKSQSVDAANALKNVDMAYKVFCDMVCFYEEHKSEYDKELDNYIQESIGIFLRSIYNIFLRNYRVKNAYASFKSMDQKIEKTSLVFHDFVSKENLYIKLLQNNGKAVFMLLGTMMNVYKSFS